MEIDRKVLGMVDYLLVNEVEIKFLCGTEFDLENIGKSIMELRKTYKNNIIVTLGESGSIMIEASGKVHRQPAYRVTAVDSTGAGDAFTGGFILGLSMGLSLPECIEIGNAAGAFSVTGWVPTASSDVLDLAVTADTVYAGLEYGNSAEAFDRGSAATLSWAPVVPDVVVSAVEVDGFQVVLEADYVKADCFAAKQRPIVVPARTFLSQLL